MLLSKVLGVIIIARNGDRFNYYQDPLTYAGSNAETTALGEVACCFPLIHQWLTHLLPGGIQHSGLPSSFHILRQQLSLIHWGNSLRSGRQQWSQGPRQGRSRRHSRFRLCHFFAPRSLPTQPEEQDRSCQRNYCCCTFGWISVCSRYVMNAALPVRLHISFCACTVETVEPGNDRSLEGWTNCPVRRNRFLVWLSRFDRVNIF